jgi:Ribbon-helix-helix protein, copG family
MKSDRTAEFLRNMTADAEPVEVTPSTGARSPVAPRPKVQDHRPPTTPSRAGLKHFGGYLDDDTLEKIALLRVRLKKDNSELIRLAIDELYARHNAKRAFGDA